ncbi:SEL1-like repeat protein [Shinella daejeonensis]|uniref:tetratricopeptide repeat protein n=1 Tax=Shinella daejeonensis TaxID=659017 RepID=UPI0020C7DD05|nr:SEL1-like repeat protein [Shinella daejeonensis]MCP8894986.1 SEL1-like repeat protein [Shinella daejeonensis]
MRARRTMGLLAAVLLWSTTTLAMPLETTAFTDPLHGGLSQNRPFPALQPALGRTLSQLADLYVDRRIDKAKVAQLLESYERRLRAAGPDTIIAVSAPGMARDSGDPVPERPDGNRARALYEQAIAYGYHGALIGLGELYLQGDLLRRDEARAFAAFSAAAKEGSAEGALHVAELTIRGAGTTRDVAKGTAMLHALADSDRIGVLNALGELCLSGRVPVQRELAVGALQKAAALGSDRAHLRLGDFYSSQDALPVDYTLALDHYRQAAGQGNIEARIRLAEMRARGEGMAQDLRTATAELQTLADRGEAAATIALGDIYAAGPQMQSDPDRAVAYYRQAVEQGSVRGMLRLGDFYSGGGAALADYAVALDYYHRAAEKGDIGAKIRVAEMQAWGQGVRQDAAAAKTALNILSAKGEPGASLALGDLYRKGPATVPSDSQLALAYYRQAVSQGSVTAQLRLGDFYSEGETAKTDYPLALAHYRDAAEKGNIAAKVRLAEMKTKGQGMPRDIAAATAELNILSARGEAYASLVLGDLYAKGDVVPPVLPVALDYYRQAVAQGSVTAMLRLGDFFSRQETVLADYRQAIEYYRAAGARGNVIAKVRLAEMKARGHGFAQNAGGAKIELGELAALGEADASLALGDLYGRWGTFSAATPALAQYYYRQAATRGSVTALLRLGDFHSDSSLSSVDYPGAIENYRRAAERGNVEARIRLGEMKSRGQGFAQDVAAARRELETLAMAGEGGAFLALGDMYGRGEVVPVDRDLALRYYGEAASHGSVTALLRLGDLHRSAAPGEAFAAYRTAADRGSLDGRLRVAELTIRGEGTTRDIEAGMAELRALADSDSTGLLETLAEVCLSGRVTMRPELAVAALDKAARLGSVRARLRLGDLYSEGEFLPVDYPRALDHYRQAAALENTEAKIRLAEMQAAGQGIAQDVPAALAELRSLADRGDVTAALSLGDLYGRGQVLPADPETARRYYRQAARAGNAVAMLRLGDGDRRTDPAKAFAAYSAAAERGNLEGRLRVAELTIRGEGTEKDIDAGITALRALAGSENPGFLETLADLSLSGRVPLQVRLAVDALDKASRLGSSRAHRRLGDLYSAGEDVKADYAAAIGHYRQAAGEGDMDARVRLAEMKAYGQGLEQDPEAALDELAALAAAGAIRASLALGDLYGRAQVIRIDPARAEKYYREAASQGSISAMLRLGDAYGDGRFGKRDRAQAARYYHMAWEAGSSGAVLSLGRLEASTFPRRSAAAGVEKLQHALRENVVGAPTALAEALFYGYGIARNGKEALALLHRAATEWDRSALLDLVAAYRDGKRDGRVRLVRKDIAKAKALLLTSADMLSEPTASVQGFLLEAAVARLKTFPRLEKRLADLTQPERRRVVRALPKTNANLFAYVTKVRFREQGVKAGRPDGRLDRQLIAAITRHCRTLLSARQCGRGPFTPRVVETVSQMF